MNASPTTIYALRQLIVTISTLFAIIQLRNQFLSCYLFLPSTILFKSSPNKYEKLRLKNLNEIPNLQSISIRTSDGLLLDGIEWKNPKLKEMSDQDSKWILWFNPNAATYEEETQFLVDYGNDVGANILSFNYRGVGRSQGYVKHCDDLVEDGMAAIQFLLARGISSKNILIHGHSLGAGIGTLVREKFPDGPVINDRSFRSFSAVAASTVNKIAPLRIISTSLIGGVFTFYSTSFMVENIGKSFLYGLGGAVFGGLVGYVSKSIPQKLVYYFINSIGWKMDALAAWPKLSGDKGVVFHRLDGVIHYESASFARVLGSLERTSSVIELNYFHPNFQKEHQIYHVYGLNTLANEWRNVVNLAKRFLRISS